MDKRVFRALQHDNLFSDHVSPVEFTKSNRKYKLAGWGKVVSGEIHNDIYLWSFKKSKLPIVDAEIETVVGERVKLMRIGRTSKYVERAKRLYSEELGYVAY